MPTSFKHLQIDRLKREAKVSRKSLNISHNQALDLIANREGFSNWSLLMKRAGIQAVAPNPTASSELKLDLIKDAAKLAGYNVYLKPRGQYSIKVEFDEQTIDFNCRGRDIWIEYDRNYASVDRSIKWCMPRPEIASADKFFVDVFNELIESDDFENAISTILGIGPGPSIGYCKEYWENNDLSPAL